MSHKWLKFHSIRVTSWVVVMMVANGVWCVREETYFIVRSRISVRYTFFFWGWIWHTIRQWMNVLWYLMRKILKVNLHDSVHFSHTFLFLYRLRIRSYDGEEISFVVRFCWSDDVFWIKYSLFILAFSESWDVSCLFSWLEILTGSCSCKNVLLYTYNQSLNHAYWYVSSFACLAWVESGYGRVYDQSIGK